MVRKIDYLYPLAIFSLYLLPLFITSPYVLHILITSLIYSILTGSYSIMVGRLGMLSLSQIAFFGIGAYTSALLSLNIGTPFLINFMIAGITTAIITFLLGTQVLKLTRHSFAIATLAFMLITQLVALNWVDVTRGALGLPRVPRPDIMGIHIVSKVSYYYLVLTVASVTFLFLYMVVNSRVGRAFISIREDDPLAKAVGVNCFKYKMVGFVISGFFAGIAGSLYVHYATYIGPEIFHLYFVIVILIMVIIGGADNLGGVVLASFLFTAIPEFLRATQILRETVYGIILILLVLTPEKIKKKFKASGLRY